MILTNKQILASVEGLMQLADKEPENHIASFRIGLAVRTLRPIVEQIMTTQREIAVRFARRDEKNELITTPEGIALDNPEAYKAATEVLMAEELDLPIKPLTWPMLKGVKLSGKLAAELEWFIEGEPE